MNNKLQITNKQLSITNMKGDIYAIPSFKSAVAQESEVHLSAGCPLSKDNQLQINNLSHLCDNQLTVSKRSNTMETTKVVAASRNANKENNHSFSNNQISKRSNVMNTTNLFTRGLIALFAIFIITGLAIGQNNLVLSGGTVTNTGTIKVKGNITNSGVAGATTIGGTVQLKADATQTIGTASNGAINFSTLVIPATAGKTKTFNVNSTVASTIDILASAGADSKYDIGANKLILQGAIDNTGAATTPYEFSTSGAEVDYAGGAQGVFQTTYDKLTVSAAGTKLLDGSLAVTSALSVSAGDLSIGANTLTVNGTYSVAGTITGGTSSNLTLNGSGDIAAFTVASGLNNLVLNRSGNIVTLSAPLTLAGAATLTAGTFAVASQTLTLNGTGAVISGAGSLTSASDGTVNYNQNAQNVIAANYGNLTFTAGNKTLASSGTIGIAGIFSNLGGTHTVTGSTVDFNGTTQNIAAFTFNNLSTHGAASTKTATGTIQVDGAFNNGGIEDQAVTLAMGTQTLTLNGTKDNAGATVQFAGLNNGVLFSTGTVEYNGDIAQNITGGGDYANLVLSTTSASTKSIQTGVTVGTTTSLTVPSGVTLQLVDATSTLNLKGTADLTVATGATLDNAGTIDVGN